MRANRVLLMTTILLVAGAMGCVKPDPDFESPLGTIPKVLIDYIDDQTKVYVQAVNDHRYSNISIRVYQGNDTLDMVSDSNVYFEHMNVDEKEFSLNVTVWDKLKLYAFEANFTVEPASDPEAVFLITVLNLKNPENEPKEKRITENNLPWRTLLDRII